MKHCCIEEKQNVQLFHCFSPPGSNKSKNDYGMKLNSQKIGNQQGQKMTESLHYVWENKIKPIGKKVKLNSKNIIVNPKTQQPCKFCSF